MKLEKFLLFLCLVVSSVAAKAEIATVAVDGLYYAVDPSGSYKYATLVAPTNSSYTGDIKVPNTIAYNGVQYTVRYILKTAFNNSAITSIVLPYSFSFVDEPQLSSGGSGVLASNSFSLTGASTSSLISDEAIEKIREAYHKTFDSCMALKEIYTWADAKTTTETKGDGHIYYDNFYKPFSDSWGGTELYRWHIYTPKNTNPQVKFTDAVFSAYRIYFVFSIGNFSDYPTVESIEFPAKLMFDRVRFFNSDVKINCPKLKKYIYNGQEKSDGCLYYGNQIFAIPPGITGNLTISNIRSIYDNSTLANSNVTKLTIKDAPNGSSYNMFENFDGDISIETFIPSSWEDDYFTSFSNVKPGHIRV